MKNEKKKSQQCNVYKKAGVILGACLGAIMGAILGSNILNDVLLGGLGGIMVGIVMGILMGISFDSKVNASAYTVKEIIEDDHGCEGLLVDEEPKVTIVVVDKSGNEKEVRMSDKLALEYNIEENDRVTLKDGVTLKPVWKG